MKLIRLKWAGFSVLGMTILMTTGKPATAEMIRVVAPAAAADLEGGLSVSPGTAPYKAQFLYPASDFAGLPDSNRLIVALNLRSDRKQTQPVDWTLPNQQIWMSTSDKDDLSEVFADNHGANKTLVYDGAITYSLLATGPLQGPRDVADGMRLQTLVEDLTAREDGGVFAAYIDVE